MAKPNILKQQTILIGKDPIQNRLMIAIKGYPTGATIGAIGSVPNSVSRCLPKEDKAHVSLSVDVNGSIILKNLNVQNITLVNGAEILSKHIQPSDKVELGKDHFKINLPLVLDTAQKIIEVNSPSASTPKPAKEYDISHLQKVWANYHNKTIAIRKRQQHQALMARIPMFFTMGGGAISSIAFALGWGDEVKALCISLTLLGLVVMVYAFVKSKNDTSLEDNEKLVEEFQDKYICPNPDCGKFLGNLSYKLMKRQYSMCCPHCKCKYTEK